MKLKAFTGFEDDIKKIKAQQNLGLSARAKLMLQIAVAMLPAFYIICSNQTTVSFLNFSIDLGWFYPVFVAFMIVGASNAVNLTDGLDGLAASSSVVAFLACVKQGADEHNDTDEDFECDNEGCQITLDGAPKDENEGIDFPIVPN